MGRRQKTVSQKCSVVSNLFGFRATEWKTNVPEMNERRQSKPISSNRRPNPRRSNTNKPAAGFQHDDRFNDDKVKSDEKEKSPDENQKPREGQARRPNRRPVNARFNRNNQQVSNKNFIRNFYKIIIKYL